jgi:protease-4
MERSRLMTLLDGRQWPPAELQRAGLVDSLGDRAMALRMLGRLAGTGGKPATARLTQLEPAERPWRKPRPIAVVYAAGGIEIGRSGSDFLNGPYMGSETLEDQLAKAFGDGEVKAVVLRVESPGGSSLASDLIHHTLERLKRETKKPLIVSMGSVAASGGYQISLPGDKLFADRFTRTGSIGVLFVKPSLEGFYAKRGVREEDFDRGSYMKGWSYARDWDARDQAAADSAVRTTYAGFKRKVGSARRLTPEQVEQVAQGRVWYGDEAHGHRLVDEMGGLEEAIAAARSVAHVPAGEKIDLLTFRRPAPSLIERLVGTALRETWEQTLSPREVTGLQLRAFVDDE